MLKDIVAGALDATNEVECLRGGEGRLGGSACAANHSDQIGVEPPADHRRRLEQVPIGRGEPVNARSEQRLHAFRQRGSDRGRIEVQAGSGATDDATLNEEARDLFGEEGVAFRPRRDQLCQRLGQ